MATSPSSSATLAISAADEATEIFLVDANLKRIASGLGKLELAVPLGIYKVRFRSGATQHDELVEVSSPGSRVPVRGSPIEFRTAAPIEKTLTTHEYQSGSASNRSREVDVKAGVGGALFVFVREVDEDRDFTPGGVRILALDGREVATIEAGASAPQDRWSALNVSLDPGTYSVRVASGRLGNYELFATVCKGWQTQVFMVMDDFWVEGSPIRAPSLRTASILMSRRERGFDPRRPATRLAELARKALEQGRNVASPGVMKQFLHGKFEDPMLGIVAANIVLQRHRPDRELVDVVIGNLRRALQDHPDLDALAVTIKGGSQERVETISRPPTLLRSWDHIVKASRRRATLVPPESPLALIADEVVIGGPWLIHRLDEERRTRRKDNASIAQASRLVQQLISANPERLAEMAQRTRTGEEDLSSLERAVLIAAMSYVEGLRLKSDPGHKRSVRASAREMLGHLSAPSYSIANAVKDLTDKLKLG